MRNVAAAILVSAAVALLGVLVYLSRPVDAELHVDHNALRNDLSGASNDFSSLVTLLRQSRDGGTAPGAAAERLIQSLAARPPRVAGRFGRLRASASVRQRVQNAYQGFQQASRQVTELADPLTTEQTEFAQALTVLRETGPQVVQQLRSSGDDRQAADLFQAVVGTVEYARAQSGDLGEAAVRALAALRRDASVSDLPASVSAVVKAAQTVRDSRDDIGARLKELAALPLARQATALGQAEDAAYSATLERTNQARMLLSVYAVLILLATGLTAWRLHQSYRQINDMNAELEAHNARLEQRVAERTAELSHAYEDLKESQVQLVQAEKMSSLGQLVAGISHEINTPLLFLSNNAELIRERLRAAATFVEQCQHALTLRPQSGESRTVFQERFVAALKRLRALLKEDDVTEGISDARDLIEDSITGLEDLSQLAQSLKDFSRLDRAPVSDFNVNDGLDKTLTIARNLLKNRISVERHFGEVATVRCSPSQINQVFLNLITNAAQAIEGEGTITLTTEQQDPDHVIVRIADTGCGISQENLARIRDPFFTTKAVGTGTGLGLSIVDDILRKHDGEMLVDSAEGEGSTFTLIFAVAPAPGTEEQAPRETATEPSAETASDGLARAM